MILFRFFWWGAFVWCLLSIQLAGARWMDNVVSHTIYAPKQVVFQLYSCLDQHPKWSPWLEKVEFNQATGLSQWTIYSLGLRYSWESNNTVWNPPYSMQWESLSGLPNKGKVEFLTDKSSTPLEIQQAPSKGEESEDIEEDLIYENVTIQLTISYDLPTAAAIVLKTLGPIANSFIYSTILGDLKRFGKHVDEHLRETKKKKQKNLVGSEL